VRLTTCLVPFVGFFVGLKLAGLSPTKCPAKSPAKKNALQNPNSDSQIPTSWLRRYSPGHIMIEIPYSDVIQVKDISIITWPGKNRRSHLGGIWESELGFLRGSSRARDILPVRS